jgi:hypothetical protein
MPLLEQQGLYCPLHVLSPFSRSDPARVSVVVKGYFDGSGQIGHRSPRTIVLAGYAASEALWSEFESRWEQMLARHNTGSLHMRDIYPHRDPTTREVLGWQMKRVKAIVYDATQLLNHLDPEHHDLFGYSCIVYMDDYRRYQQKHPKVREAEAICVDACVGTLIAERGQELSGLQVYFDRGEPFLRTIDRIWRSPSTERPAWAERVATIAPVDGERILPIQAADLLAWLSNRHFVTDDVRHLMWPMWGATMPAHASFTYDRLVSEYGA